MSRHRVLTAPYTLAVAILVLQAAGCLSGERPSEPARPNIILIISDDHGWPYYGFMGDSIAKTPNIDALAEAGIVFPYGFANASACRPSLMSLLTGLYTTEWDLKNAALLRTGAMTRDHVMRFREVMFYRTLPRELARVGYTSFQGGKHWEGLFEEAGFSAGTKTGRGTNTLDWQRHAGADSMFGRESIQPALDFIDSHTEQPFFMWFSPTLPHRPHDAGDEYRRLYQGTALDADASAYYANISRLDARVGELMQHLEKRHLKDDTLVIFLADNGWDVEQPADSATHRPDAVNRGKHSAHELGFRTPVVVSWPGRFPPTRNNALLLGIDVFATILDYAGAPALADRSGVSMRAALEGRSDTIRSHVVEKFSPHQGRAGNADTRQTTHFVRTPSWRYTREEPSNYEQLFRIDADPFETEDVLAENPAVASELRAYIDEWRARLRVPIGDYEIDGLLVAEEPDLPTAGIRLRLNSSSGVAQALELETTTDAAGRFLFRDVPAGEFTLSTSAKQYSLSDLSSGRAEVTISLPQGTLGGHVRVGARKDLGDAGERPARTEP